MTIFNLNPSQKKNNFWNEISQEQQKCLESQVACKNKIIYKKYKLGL